MSVSGVLVEHLLSEKESSFDSYQRDESEESLLTHPIAAKDRIRRGRQNITLYLGLVLLLLNALWSVYMAVGITASGTEENRPNLIYSPAREAVSYETVTTNSTLENSNGFRGRPSPEVSKMWFDSYTKWVHVVVSEDDLNALGRESVPLSDGSGYLATLGVFHQLHCLDMVRQYIFRDYYWSLESEQRRFEHMDHCMDTIRLALMCQSDISLVTFNWQEDEWLPAANFHTTHECRNWDSILDWAKSHQANMSLVVRPEQ